MMTKLLALTVFISILGNGLAVASETEVTLETGTGTLAGTLLVPDDSGRPPVALLIVGSGPTDRDGNSPKTKNNAHKMLAQALAKHGIGSLRYDKRGIGMSKVAAVNEADLRFEHYISDVKDWLVWLKQDQRFSDLVVIGHSEGALLGMVASQEVAVDKFISIAGPALPADQLLKRQLQSQPAQVFKMSSTIIDQLANGQTVDNVNPMLRTLFRPSVQPYMISWFRYDPLKEIAKLEIPILIIQGSTDIQVSQQDATILAEANPNAEKKIIAGMNHILKKSVNDRMKNIQTYNQPDLPIMTDVVESIVEFIDND